MTKPIKYKQTGLEWCPQIPEHWKTSKLKWASTIYSGGTPDRLQDEFWGGTIPWLNSGSVNQFVIVEPSEYITEEGYRNSSAKWIKPGSVVIGLAGQGKTKGMAAIVQIETTCNQSMGVIEPASNNVIGKYLLYFLRVNYYNIRGIAGEGQRDGLNLVMIGDIQVPLPPLMEQQKIADYLDRKTSLIDSIISKKEKQIGLYKEERTAVINHAVTKGLNPDVEMKDSGIEWLGSIPKHWEVKKLKYCAKIKTGRTPKIQGSNIDFFENGTFNWFTPSDFRENILLSSGRKINNLAIDNLEVDIYPPMSIYLIGIGATVGKISYSETVASCNQQINVIVFTDRIIPKFGYYYLLGQKDQILSLVDYTTLPILNQSKSKEIDFIYLEDCTEQEEIVTYLDNETNRIDTLVSKTSKQIELLKEYKEALINEVVTGQRIIH